jgi:hypothetical protein
MNSLTRQKQNQVKELKNIVGSHVPDTAVIEVLKGSNWNADSAMDKWY